MSQLRAKRVPNAVRSTRNWQLGSLLGGFALVMPLLSVFGVSDGRPWVPVLTMVVITILWIGVVVLVGDRRPIPTLAIAGGTYGVLAIGVSIVLQGGLSAPVFAIPAIILTNAVWGVLAGIAAAGIDRSRAD
ncbi:hypothetical protein [Natrinema soli]|uniref:Uncharacterized protein n=1 Tax=Natrinema soli TaxID=1930624 RepID=A0ABD5SGZ7_9EURY|nr:hypothetical protein [Natrinema soli]